MLRKDRWEEIRRLAEQHVTISEIARRLAVDRKTIRRCLRQESWVPYSRAPRANTLIAQHEDFVRRRAPEVRYSARALFHELRRDHGYTGSYETVKVIVRRIRPADLGS